MSSRNQPTQGPQETQEQFDARMRHARENPTPAPTNDPFRRLPVPDDEEGW